MPKSVEQELFDSAVRHAIHLESYKNSQVIQVLQQLEYDVFPALLDLVSRKMARIKGRGSTYSLRNTESGKDLVRTILLLLRDKYTGIFSNHLKPSMEELAIVESQIAGRDLTKVLKPFDVSLSRINIPQLRALVTKQPIEGKLLKEWMNAHLPLNTHAAVVRRIEQGLSIGSDIDDIVKSIRGTRKMNFEDGVLVKPKKELTGLVRTAAAQVSASAREMTYDENTDVVKGVRIVATLDARTTPVCRAQDGKVYDVDKGPRPPFHWNCRTTTVPVLKSFEEMGLTGLNDIPAGTRASMNGPVPADMTYDKWLRTQPVGFQDRVLGKEKAELFRNGLTLDKFVNDYGKSLTLDELRKLYGVKPVVATPAPARVRVVTKTVSEASTAQKQWKEELTPKERRAVFSWTAEEYTKIRKMDLEDTPKSTKIGTYDSTYEDFQNALEKAPRFEGTVWRGIRVTHPEKLIQQIKASDVVTMEQTSSASVKQGIAEEFASKEGISKGFLFKFESKSGVPVWEVSSFPHEQEVIIPKGSKFKFLSLTENKDSYEVHLEEI